MTTHGPSKKMLFSIWLSLIGLLVLTWGAAELDLGEWNVVVALTIAVAKMLLVVLIFMQVRYSAKLIWIYVAAGFFWLAFLVTLTMTDYLTRGLNF